jgi:hypothetical protein
MDEENHQKIEKRLQQNQEETDAGETDETGSRSPRRCELRAKESANEP